MHKLPAPSFILWAQLFGTAVAVKAAHMGGLISHLDALEYDKLRAFFPVALIFCATIFTNIKSLEYANVETFMIFRSRRAAVYFYCRLCLPRKTPTLGTVVVVPRHALAGSHGLRINGRGVCGDGATCFVAYGISFSAWTRFI